MMNSSKSSWFAFAALLVAVLLTGCPPSDQASDEGVDQLPTGDPSTQCLRWETNCDGECVDRLSDVQNCGACGNVCEGGKLCSAGSCVHNCPEGTRRCGDACVDLDTSEEHCGACDNRCANDGAEGYCSNGTCADWVCQPDRLDSDGDVENGCERSCEGAEVPSGRYDITMDVVDARGTVTIAGDAPEGREVGAVIFESLDTEGRPYVPIFPQDSHNYQIELFPGRYKVRLVDDQYCNPRYASCPGPVLREVVEITGDTELDMNLPSDQPFPGAPVQVSGHITVNGEELAEQPQNGYRARVTFANSYRHHQVWVDGQGPATFEQPVPSGTYRVSVRGINCTDHALPCQEKVVAEEMVIRSATEFEWDFETVEFYGVVTANGAQLSDSASGRSRGAVQLRPTDPSLPDTAIAPITPSGRGEFSIEVYPGTYELWMTNSSDCPTDGSGAIPCGGRLLETDVELDSDTGRDIDLEIVTLSGEVTLNGREMIDSPATRNRGQIQLSDDQGQYTLRFGQAGGVEFAIKMYPGRYEAVAMNNSGCDLSRPVIPCQSTQLGTVEVQDSRTWDVDLKVFSLTGELTLDGAEFPDNESYSRGTVTLLEPGATGGPSSDLGLLGPAEFSARIFAGDDYRIVLDYACNDDNQFLPCGRHTIARDFALDGNRDITRDLRPVEISGSLSANGRELGSLDASGILSLETEYDSIRLPLENEFGGKFTALVYPGVYRVLYRANSNRCTSEVMPCGVQVVRDAFEVRAGRSLDVDLNTVQVEGRAEFEGANVSRSLVYGEVRLRHGAVELELPVTNGEYGPVKLIQRPFVSRFESYNCRQSSPYPCMPYLIDGCER